VLINNPITNIPFIGEKQAEKFVKLGIFTIKDLLYHIPRYYKDTSSISSLGNLAKDEEHTVIVKVLAIRNIRIHSGKYIQKATVADNSGAIEVTWFNQPYLIKNIKIGDLIYLSGKLDPKSTKPVFMSPDYEVVKDNNLHLGRIVPVYSLTKGIGIKWLRIRLNDLTGNIYGLNDLTDSLNPNIKKRFELIDLHPALRKIHFPDSEAEIISARKRLAFDELLAIYQILIKERHERLKAVAPKVTVKKNNIDKFISGLPFKLTPTQTQVIGEVFEDYKKPYPMHRLLQGDVGSGKTIVSLLSALPVMDCGFRVVMLTPTSVLAEQHFQTISKLLSDKYKVILHTASSKIKAGDLSTANMIIATHAILYREQKDFDRLGLVIIDEEHRFGVEQRKALLSFETFQTRPHLLNLTATPIPRSIALSLFGQMDVSKIDKPQGRKVVQTFVVPQSKREDSIAWIKDKIHAGGQVFWVCPLINESETDEAIKSVENLFTEVQQLFPEFQASFLHGKIKSTKKNEILANFKNNKYQILIATTVIEVGIDIPNANIMIIENAEKYGLAQLHQLRGRVGRNNQEAWCLLYTKLEDNPAVTERLNFFAKENDGIKIAEFDLKTRGPGEVYGTIQAGLPNLKVANFGNIELMRITREAAIMIEKEKENI
jgi:ATP-dependent DNA helicase RecG